MISEKHADINVDRGDRYDNFVWPEKPPGYLYDHPKSRRLPTVDSSVPTYGGLQMRVRDGCCTVQGAVATWRLRSGRSLRRQVATAPCTVPEIAPLSRTRNRKLI